MATLSDLKEVREALDAGLVSQVEYDAVKRDYFRAKLKALEAKEEAIEFQKRELRAKEEFQKMELRAQEEALEAKKEFQKMELQIQKRELLAKEEFQKRKADAELRTYALESIIKHGSSIMSEEQKADLVRDYVRAKKKALEAKEEAFEFQMKELRAKEEALDANKEYQMRELRAKEEFQKKALRAKDDALEANKECQKMELRAKKEALDANKEFQKRELLAKEAFQQRKADAELRTYALESIIKHGSSIMSEEQKADLVRDYLTMSGLDHGAKKDFVCTTSRSKRQRIQDEKGGATPPQPATPLALPSPADAPTQAAADQVQTVNDEPPSKKQRHSPQERDAAPPPQPETPPPAPAAVPSPADAPTPSTGGPPANAAAALADAPQQNPARQAVPEPHILCVTEKGETLPLGQEEDQKFLASLRRFILVRTQLELGVGMYRIPRMGKEEVNLPQLYRAVLVAGGYQKAITKKGSWKVVAYHMKVPSTVTNAAYMLRIHYEKFLLDYECAFWNKVPVREKDAAPPQPSTPPRPPPAPADAPSPADVPTPADVPSPADAPTPAAANVAPAPAPVAHSPHHHSAPAGTGSSVVLDRKILLGSNNGFFEYLQKNAEIITEDWLDAVFAWRENKSDDTKIRTKTKAKRLFAEAARHGYVSILKDHATGQDKKLLDAETCRAAASGGHLDVLKWLRSQDPPCPWSVWTCEQAAENGHLDVLKWLRSQDPPCPWSVYTCQYAAKNGHLDMLKWLRSQDPPCPWSVYTCQYAAYHGHLDVLKWLRSQDPPCPWSEGTCRDAAENGHLDVLKWLRSQDPPCPWNGPTCSYYAASDGHLDVLKWLIDNGCPYDVNAYGCKSAYEKLGLA